MGFNSGFKGLKGYKLSAYRWRGNGKGTKNCFPDLLFRMYHLPWPCVMSIASRSRASTEGKVIVTERAMIC